MQWRRNGISTPKRQKTILTLFTRNLKGKLLAPKLRKSADKSLSQLGCSHYNTIYNLQLQKTIVLLRMQPPHQATLTQPFQCDLQAQIPKHPITTHISTPKAASSHRYNAAKKANRPQPVPFIAGCSHFTRKNTRFRAPASSTKQSPCNIMQPFQCDLQAQIPKHPITTHTQAHPKQLEATVTMRQKKKANRPQPHPPHRRSTFHRRLQPL